MVGKCWVTLENLHGSEVVAMVGTRGDATVYPTVGNGMGGICAREIQ
jgi:hypothetical protein